MSGGYISVNGTEEFFWAWEQGMLLDVWMLNAGTLGWRERLAAALAAGADVITTETPRVPARAVSVA